MMQKRLKLLTCLVTIVNTLNIEKNKSIFYDMGDEIDR